MAEVRGVNANNQAFVQPVAQQEDIAPAQMAEVQENLIAARNTFLGGSFQQATLAIHQIQEQYPGSPVVQQKCEELLGELVVQALREKKYPEATEAKNYMPEGVNRSEMDHFIAFALTLRAKISEGYPQGVLEDLPEGDSSRELSAILAVVQLSEAGHFEQAIECVQAIGPMTRGLVEFPSITVRVNVMNGTWTLDAVNAEENLISILENVKKGPCVFEESCLNVMGVWGDELNIEGGDPAKRAQAQAWIQQMRDRDAVVHNPFYVRMIEALEARYGL